MDLSLNNNTEKFVSKPDPWQAIRNFTNARIAIGRAGGSQRTESILDFRLSHAMAKDAVNSKFDTEGIKAGLNTLGLEYETLDTCISDKSSYLMNPDLGRILNDESRAKLKGFKAKYKDCKFAIIISDGLSGNAVNAHSVITLKYILDNLPAQDWKLYPIFLVPFARVKIQDDISEILEARHSMTLIGERPGLASPDSMSSYFTYTATNKTVESDRNCISNIRPEGLAPKLAGKKIAILLSQSLERKISGTALKDNIDMAMLEAEVYNKELQ